MMEVTACTFPPANLKTADPKPIKWLKTSLIGKRPEWLNVETGTVFQLAPPTGGRGFSFFLHRGCHGLVEVTDHDQVKAWMKQEGLEYPYK